MVVGRNVNVGYALLLLVALVATIVVAACAREPGPDTGTALFGDADLLHASDASATTSEEAEFALKRVLPSAAEIDPGVSTFSTTGRVIPSARGVIAFVQHDKRVGAPWRVYVHDQATDERTLVYQGAREIGSVAVTADASSVVFSARAPADDFEVFRLLLEPRNVQRLTFTSYDETNVSLSADGTVVAWEGEGFFGQRSVYLRHYQPDGSSTQQRLAQPLDQVQPRLSSDGSYLGLIQVQQDGRRDVLRFDLHERTYDVAYRTRLDVTHPSVTDGGTHVAFLLNDPGFHRVLVRDLSTSELERVLTNAHGIGSAHLAGDGEHLAFTLWQLGDRHLGGADVFTRHLPTGQQARMTSYNTTDVTHAGLHWAVPASVPPGPELMVLTTETSGTGTGWITSSPSGIDCGSSCDAVFEPYATVTLTAEPTSDSVLTAWTGCDVTSGNTCTITMSTPRDVTAIFDAVPTADPYGAASSLVVQSGVIAGQALGTDAHVARVAAGSVVDVGLELAYVNGWPSGAAIALGSTGTWGDPRLEVVDLAGLPAGDGITERSWTFTAPAEPGSYAIVVAFRAEFTAAQVFSLTNWAYGDPVWDDGNNIAQWSEAQFHQAEVDGRVVARVLHLDGTGADVYVPLHVPAAVIRLEVEQPSSPSHTLTVSTEGDGSGYVTSNPAGIDCGSTCAAEFLEGTDVTLDAVPSQGSVFASWEGCDSVQAHACTVAMGTPRSVAATFVSDTTDPATGTLSITVDPSDALVRVRDADANVVHEGGGNVELLLPTGVYGVRVSATGFATQNHNVEVFEDQTTSVSYALEPLEPGAGAIRVRVLDHDGSPQPTATVRLREGGDPAEVIGEGLATLKTDAEGYVTFDALQVGTYSYAVWLQSDDHPELLNWETWGTQGDIVVTTAQITETVFTRNFPRLVGTPQYADTVDVFTAFTMETDVTNTAGLDVRLRLVVDRTECEPSPSCGQSWFGQGAVGPLVVAGTRVEATLAATSGGRFDLYYYLEARVPNNQVHGGFEWQVVDQSNGFYGGSFTSRVVEPVLSATARTPGSIGLAWNESVGVDSYSLHVTNVGTGSQTSVPAGDGEASSYVHEDLGFNLDYCFTLEAHLAGGGSVSSNEACARTGEAPALAVQFIDLPSAGPLAGSQFIRWSATVPDVEYRFKLEVPVAWWDLPNRLFPANEWSAWQSNDSVLYSGFTAQGVYRFILQGRRMSDPTIVAETSVSFSMRNDAPTLRFDTIPVSDGNVAERLELAWSSPDANAASPIRTRLDVPWNWLAGIQYILIDSWSDWSNSGQVLYTDVRTEGRYTFTVEARNHAGKVSTIALSFSRHFVMPELFRDGITIDWEGADGQPTERARWEFLASEYDLCHLTWMSVYDQRRAVHDILTSGEELLDAFLGALDLTTWSDIQEYARYVDDGAYGSVARKYANDRVEAYVDDIVKELTGGAMTIYKIFRQFGQTAVLIYSNNLVNQAALNAMSCYFHARTYEYLANTIETMTLNLDVAGEGAGLVAVEASGVTRECALGTTCTEEYQPGQVISLTAIPAPGTTFTGWGGACATHGSSPTCSLTMTGDLGVTASFAIQTHELRVNLMGLGTGRVDLDPPGRSCLEDCFDIYPHGTTVTLTATPLSGSEFGGWSGDCAYAGLNTTCTVEMTQLRSVFATFARPDVYINYTRLGAGSGTVAFFGSGVECADDCRVGPFSSGDFIIMIATPDAGSEFAGWGGDCAYAGAGAMCSFGVVGQGDLAVSATFAFANRPPVVDDVWIRYDGQRFECGGYSPRTQVDFRWTAQDPDGDPLTYQYRTDGGSWLSRSGNSVVLTYPDYSQRTFEVRAIDSHGAVSDAMACPFKPSTPPVIIDRSGPDLVDSRANTSVSFTVVVRDVDGHYPSDVTLQINTGSGQFIGLYDMSLFLDNGPANALTYAAGFVFQAGTYEYTIWVYDALGGSSVTTGWQTFTIRP